MAIYTKIPESELGAVMSKLLGKAVGKFISTAKSTLTDELMNKIEEIEQKIEDGNINVTELLEAIEEIRRVVTLIRDQLLELQKNLEILSTTVESVKVPIEALKAALLVIKLIPLPQRWLVVAVTTVFSDTLEMLSELIAQIEEIVDTLLKLVEAFNDLLSEIIKYIEIILRILDLLKILASIQDAVDNIEANLDGEELEKNLQDLRDMGLVDENNAPLPYLNSFKDLTIYSDMETADKMYSEGIKALDILQNSGLSTQIKVQLQGTLDTVETVENYETAEYYYTTGTGDILTLRIVVDPTSPKIAPRRYVIALDRTGTTVYTGTKSFTTDPDILIKETKVRLIQLFG